MATNDGTTSSEAVAADGEQTKIEAIRRFIRREAAHYLDDPNITSIGTGYKVTDGVPTGELCVQFTVRKKLGSEDRPEVLGTEMIPKTVEVAGEKIPTDVIERDYKPSYTAVEAAETDIRKLRQDPMLPGISIANASSTAGTLGMIVFDRATGTPCTLSNWHVYHGALGKIGDDIVQPGPFDDNNVAGNVCGQLLRSHHGEAGDCAIASIADRGYEEEIWELTVRPREIVRVELNDPVIKSGRTTAVTVGVVRRVDVIVELNYDGVGPTRIGGFEIGPIPGSPPDIEISKGGDSGSVWMIADGDSSPTDKLAGLHFAGDADDSSDEHALACYAHSVFKKLDIALSADRPELVAAGFNPDFLTNRIAVPGLSGPVAADAVELDGDALIPYTHFSVCMSQARGFARYVAWNIDGSRIKAISRTGIAFKLDKRIPEEFQHGDDLYAGNKLDRGHIARRADLCWGTKTEAQRANKDSFFFTNIAPQHQAFNQSKRQGLWGLLENAIFEDVDVADLRLSVFGGPIFRDDDPEYRNVLLPQEFWKLLAYHDATDDTTKVRAYILTQRDLLTDLEVLELDPFQLFQVPLDRLAEDTALDFSALDTYDTFASVERPERLEAKSPRARLVRSAQELVR